MFIKRVTLADFGRLSGTIHFDPNRCNVICQDNEYGKTTIMDAVLYTLYNFPTSGFSRDTMKPKDRYRPWNNGGSRGQNMFVVELEIHDINNRNYILRADFNRQQPFTLHDVETLQPIPLDGMTFGQRYLRMPLPGFIQCFFLRQDEKEGSQRSQLVSVIEEAAASNRRDTPTSVREAIENLASPRMSVPRIGAEDVLVKTVIKRLEDRRAELRDMCAALKRNLDTHAREIEASDELDGQIADAENELVRLEYALVLARHREKQVTLDRFREGREARAERTRQLEELEQYVSFDPTRRGEVMSLVSDWKLARQRLDETRKNLDSTLTPELENHERELAALPEAAATFAPAELEELRKAGTVLADRESQLARESEKLTRLEADLRQRGVPVDRLSELHHADSVISDNDREILFEHNESRLEAQTALATIEQTALEARTQALQAKTRRSWYSNLAMGLTVAVIGLMAVGIVLLLTGVKFWGWASLAAAIVVGLGATIFVSSMKTKIAREELEPALQAEMELAAQSRQIRDKLEGLEAEYQAVLTRLSLTPEQITELREIDHWKQSAAAWTSSREIIDRLNSELAETRSGALHLVSRIQPDTAADALNPEAITGAVTSIERATALRKDRDAAAEKVTRIRSEIDSLQQDFDTKTGALEAIVTCPQTEAIADLDNKAQAWLDGCEKALQLQAIKQEYGTVQGMTDEEAAALQADLAELVGMKHSLEETHSFLSSTTVDPTMRPDEIDRRLAQLRTEREQLKERRNRGFREAEQAVSDWRTKGPELERELAEIEETLARATDFEAACQLAHSELSEISSQVYTQWATALNDRVNRIVPLINNRYTDVAVSPDLDVSVHSREANRRLEAKEIQHLSKGARDQLLLAVRIAIAEYLSAHVGNLPLALDEPFAHWDDQRFIEGMRFLNRLSASHQVILLSCHSWRYNQLKESAPEILEGIKFCQIESE